MGFADHQACALSAPNPGPAAHFQLDHEDERRWVMTLLQLERTRSALRLRPKRHDPSEYRSMVVRAVYGPPPCRLRTVHDEGAMMRIAECLAEYETVKTILRAKHWGLAGVSLVDIARAIPNAKSVGR